MKLTQKVVDGVAPDNDRVVWDDEAPGLGLRVQAGRRTWIVRYRVAGVSRQKSLPGTLPLKQARGRAAEIRTGASGGVDVVAAGRAAAIAVRMQADAAKSRSLDLLTEQYLADAAKRLRPESLRVAKLYLRTHWQSLHDRSADELGRREIISVLERYAGRVTAAQMLRHLSACLSWGVERGLLERNSALGIKPPVQLVARERVLNENEIRAVWAATAPKASAVVSETHCEFHAIIRLLLLLGQRRGEIGRMMWSELDLQRGVWHIPGTRTKNHKPHLVPLSRQASEILLSRNVEGRSHVFGRRDRGFTAWDDHKQMLDARINLPPWTVHDLRRTAITQLAELGVPPHVVEAIANHISGHKAGIAGVYNKAEYSQEKRAALQRWADHLDRLALGEDATNILEFGEVSAKGYWASFDEDDVVPIPGQPIRVGDLLVDRNLEVRAIVWSFLQVKAKDAMRDAYLRAAAVPDMTDGERISILTKAAVRIGLGVLDKFEEVDKQRREMAALAREVAIRAKHDERWGVVREMLCKDGRRSALQLAKSLRANKSVKHPPAPSEQKTFERYVRVVKEEMKVPHSLSE